MIYLEPQSLLNDCILSIDHKKNVLVYSYSLLLEKFVESGMTYIDAIEHIDFNIISMSMKGWPIIYDDYRIDDVESLQQTIVSIYEEQVFPHLDKSDYQHITSLGKNNAKKER